MASTTPMSLWAHVISTQVFQNSLERATTDYLHYQLPFINYAFLPDENTILPREFEDGVLCWFREETMFLDIVPLGLIQPLVYPFMSLFWWEKLFKHKYNPHLLLLTLNRFAFLSSKEFVAIIKGNLCIIATEKEIKEKMNFIDVIPSMVWYQDFASKRHVLPKITVW